MLGKDLVNIVNSKIVESELDKATLAIKTFLNDSDPFISKRLSSLTNYCAIKPLIVSFKLSESESFVSVRVSYDGDLNEFKQFFLKESQFITFLRLLKDSAESHVAYLPTEISKVENILNDISQDNRARIKFHLGNFYSCIYSHVPIK